MPPVSQGRTCEACGDVLVIKNTRDITRKRFCSAKCVGFASALAISKSQIIPLRDCTCARCGTVFKTRWSKAKFCGRRCMGAAMAMAMNLRRATLEGHLAKLRGRGGRGAMTQDHLLSLYHAQNGRCALSGVRMTWEAGKGRVATNISLDRIAPKGQYVPGNVRLVCHVVNLMRRDMPDRLFAEWCALVVAHTSFAMARVA